MLRKFPNTGKAIGFARIVDTFIIGCVYLYFFSPLLVVISCDFFILKYFFCSVAVRLNALECISKNKALDFAARNALDLVVGMRKRSVMLWELHWMAEMHRSYCLALAV